METKIIESNTNERLTADEVAILLVDLYASYKCAIGNFTDERTESYAKAVGIAIRMLNKED